MKNSKVWIFWLVLVLVVMTYFTHILLDGEDKSLFMPGELSSGHHQIGIDCKACHVDSFTDTDAMQKTCENCHGEQRKKPFDSHPRSKFTDPRNADRLENIDALHCVSCHVEHKPEITQKTGLTQPVDFCVHCHKNIAKDRPSHEGMEFNTCASAGCHNYHNNRALYTDFLVKHMHEPALLDKRQLPEREFVNVLAEIITYPHDRYPVEPLSGDSMDAPENKSKMDEINHQWLDTAHAKSGANCSACHVVKTDDKAEATWTDSPDHRACAQCHDIEVKQFMQGKHGMRLKQGLSPMTPAQAILPMKQDVAHEELTCNSCHSAHNYDVKHAAVDACLQCHDDQHSLAYKKSPHFKLWQKELSGELPPGSGVSCASCHMPRVSLDVNDWLRRTVVQHNQNATLVPNEKMIRPACMHCHGLGYSIDSLADEALIKNNFQGHPTVHIESIDMAEKDHLRHLKEKEAGEH